MRRDSQNLMYTYCYRSLHYVMKFHPWFHRRLEFHFRHLHWKKQPFSLFNKQIKSRGVCYQNIVIHIMFKYTTLKQQTRRWLILKKTPSDVKSSRSSSTSSLMTNTIIPLRYYLSFFLGIVWQQWQQANAGLQSAAVIHEGTALSWWRHVTRYSRLLVY